ncbi:hypothetical protein pEaSNUABM55_00221 [Erwinia phage pEa_SNUABM_55]|nr:hypothetical protein pEaSNUABM55_00221 [Erwinia phage pEa_SNUABM_55]
MLIKVVDADWRGELQSIQANATYQLPRKGELVSFDSRLYLVTEVTHNLAEGRVTVTVEQQY